MGIRFTAILPRHAANYTAEKAAVDEMLKLFATEAQKRLREYPPWRPWIRPPKTGLHAGGNRTGTLGRGWESYKLTSGKSVVLENRVEYAQYVQGVTTQTPAMANRGWKRVNVVGADAAILAVSWWRARHH